MIRNRRATRLASAVAYGVIYLGTLAGLGTSRDAHANCLAATQASTENAQPRDLERLGLAMSPWRHFGLHRGLRVSYRHRTVEVEGGRTKAFLDGVQRVEFGDDGWMIDTSCSELDSGSVVVRRIVEFSSLRTGEQVTFDDVLGHVIPRVMIDYWGAPHPDLFLLTGYLDPGLAKTLVGSEEARANGVCAATFVNPGGARGRIEWIAGRRPHRLELRFDGGSIYEVRWLAPVEDYRSGILVPSIVVAAMHSGDTLHMLSIWELIDEGNTSTSPTLDPGTAVLDSRSGQPTQQLLDRPMELAELLTWPDVAVEKAVSNWSKAVVPCAASASQGSSGVEGSRRAQRDAQPAATVRRVAAFDGVSCPQPPNELERRADTFDEPWTNLLLSAGVVAQARACAGAERSDTADLHRLPLSFELTGFPPRNADLLSWIGRPTLVFGSSPPLRRVERTSSCRTCGGAAPGASEAADRATAALLGSLVDVPHPVGSQLVFRQVGTTMYSLAALRFNQAAREASPVELEQVFLGCSFRCTSQLPFRFAEAENELTFDGHLGVHWDSGYAWRRCLGLVYSNGVRIQLPVAVDMPHPFCVVTPEEAVFQEFETIELDVTAPTHRFRWAKLLAVPPCLDAEIVDAGDRRFGIRLVETERAHRRHACGSVHFRVATDEGSEKESRVTVRHAVRVRDDQGALLRALTAAPDERISVVRGPDGRLSIDVPSRMSLSSEALEMSGEVPVARWTVPHDARQAMHWSPVESDGAPLGIHVVIDPTADTKRFSPGWARHYR